MRPIYTTTDIGLAAALQCIGMSLVTMDTSDPHRVNFIFENDSDMEVAVSEYYNKKLHVPAHGFYLELKSLKARIMSARPRR